MFLCVLFPLSLVHIDAAEMGVQTVEVTAAAVATPPAVNDVEKGNIHWGKNMQRWRNDNIDIAKGSYKHFISFFFFTWPFFPLSFRIKCAPAPSSDCKTIQSLMLCLPAFLPFWMRNSFDRFVCLRAETFFAAARNEVKKLRIHQHSDESPPLGEFPPPPQKKKDSRSS